MLYLLGFAAPASSGRSASRTRSSTSTAATIRSPTILAAKLGVADHDEHAADRDQAATTTGRTRSRSRTAPGLRSRASPTTSCSRCRSRSCGRVDFSKAGFNARQDDRRSTSSAWARTRRCTCSSTRASGATRAAPARRTPTAATRTRGRSRAPRPGAAGCSSGTPAATPASPSAAARCSRRCEELPAADRAGAAGRDRAVERQGRPRLLDRLPVDEGLVLLLEGRAVHALLRRRGRAAAATATSPASTPRRTSRATCRAPSRRASALRARSCRLE